MNRNDFTITLFPKNVENIKIASQFMLPEQKDVMFFTFEAEPNISIGDIFSLRIIIENNRIIRTKAEILAICQPLLQPADKENFAVYKSILSKFFVYEYTDHLGTTYFDGKAHKDEWTIYFKVIKGDKK